MTLKANRRQVLRQSLILGAGLGVRRLAVLAAQDENAGEDSVYLNLSGSIRPVHDPVMIKEGDTYHLFCTGTGIAWRRSSDMLHWSWNSPPRAVGRMPAWVREKVPGVGDLWAPDIAYFNDRFHLYYSASTFGSNRSVIGLMTTPTLDSDADNFGWEDQGLVVETDGSQNYNAIDPNLVLDADGLPWLSFGSHWGGIKLVRLDYATGLPSQEDTTVYDIAQRAVHPRAVEAPFIIWHEGYHYLFVSFDQCCNGVNSSYRVMVGRSEVITGPYLDREGVDMMADGGTQLTSPTERWRGPGHNGLYEEDGIVYIVHHAYDADQGGAPTLRIAPLSWDDAGWPSVGTPMA